MDVGAKLGHYEIMGRLGAGGMGEVYRARDSMLDRDVAIKVLPAALASNATQLARFEREAKLLAAVVHPNIATIHGVEAGGEQPYLVMELVHGTTLADQLRDGPLPVNEAREILAHLAHGLEAAHQQGIVHRDLKPANVMLAPDGLVKILDFGIAKARRPGTGSPSGEASAEDPTAALDLTAVGAAIGTAPYMSPEQVRGKPVDARTDIWAFGCVAYEILTGRRAFARETAADTLSAILNDEPDWEALPSRTPAYLRSLLAHCLEKNSHRRLHSIADARIELEDSRTDTGIATGGAHGPVSTPSRGQFRWVAAALASLAVVALAADVGGLRSSLFGGVGGASEGTASTTTLASVASVVALPSSVIGEQAQQYLTEAVPKWLTAGLVRSGTVAARQPPSQLDADRFEGDLAALANIYAVDAFVMSTVLVGEEDFTLQLQLIAPESQDVLWVSDDYAGELEQLLTSVQSAVGDLAAALGRETAATGTPAATSENAEAQLAFEEGKYFLDRYGNLSLQEDYAHAHAALQEALDLDPGLADAAAWLAFLAYAAVERGGSWDEVAEEVQAWTDRALAIDSTNGLAWSMRSVVEQMDPATYDLVADFEYVLRSAAFAPESADASLSLAFVIRGASLRLGQVALKHAIRQDPLHVWARVNLAGGYLLLDEHDLAITTMREAVAIEPSFGGGPVMTWMLTASGQYDEAEAMMARFLQARADRGVDFPEVPTWVWVVRAELAAAQGDTAAADELSKELLDLLDSPDAGVFDGINAATFIGEALIRHRPSVALRILLRARELVYDLLMPFAFDVLRDNPKYDPLRDEPAFQDLLEDKRQQYEWTIAALQAAQRRGDLPAYLDEPLALEVQRMRSGYSQ